MRLQSEGIIGRIDVGSRDETRQYRILVLVHLPRAEAFTSRFISGEKEREPRGEDKRA